MSQNSIIFFIMGIVLFSLFLVGCDSREEVEQDFEPDTTLKVRVFSPDEQKYIFSDIYVWKDNEFLDVYSSRGQEQVEIPVEMGDEIKIVSLDEEYPYADRIQNIKVTGDTNIELLAYKRSTDIDMDCFYYVGEDDYKRYMPIQEKGHGTFDIKTKDKFTMLSNPFVPVITDYRVRWDYDFARCYGSYEWSLYTEEQSYKQIDYNQIYCNITNNDEGSRFYLKDLEVFSEPETSVFLIDEGQYTANPSTESRKYSFSSARNIDSSYMTKPRIFYRKQDFDETGFTIKISDEVPYIEDISASDREKYEFIKTKVDLENPEFTIDILQRDDILWLERCEYQSSSVCSAFCDRIYPESPYGYIEVDFQRDGQYCCCYFEKKINFLGNWVDGKAKACYDEDRRKTFESGDKTLFV